MRKASMCVLTTVVWLSMGAMAAPAPLRVQPAEGGVYTEEFTTYAAKDYLERSVWDIWAGALRLARHDAVPQYMPAVAIDGSGSAAAPPVVVVWHDNRNTNYDIYAQKVDGAGNGLWAADVRVDGDAGTATQWCADVAVDGNGDIIVVWQDGRNGSGGDTHDI